LLNRNVRNSRFRHERYCGIRSVNFIDGLRAVFFYLTDRDYVLGDLLGVLLGSVMLRVVVSSVAYASFFNVEFVDGQIKKLGLLI